jgi:hypothetical protein
MKKRFGSLPEELNSSSEIWRMFGGFLVDHELLVFYVYANWHKI